MHLLFTLLAIFTVPARALEFNPRLPPSLTAELKEDLRFLSSLRGAKATPFHEAVFGSPRGETYLLWLEARLNEIDYDPASSEIARFEPRGQKVILTPFYAEHRRQHPQVFRLATLLHEARHSDPGFDSHADCPAEFKDEHGRAYADHWDPAAPRPLAGQPACEFQSLGGYGVMALFLRNIALYCDSCSAQTRAEADRYVPELLARITSPGEKAMLMRDLYP